MHLRKARLRSCPVIVKRAAFSCGLAAILVVCGGRALQNAIAEGDTRTISLHHIHTNEDITITFKRDGRYDEAALNKLNWFLRDWRKQQETKMDPHLIDLIWEVQREAGSKEPVWVVCGYRSPETNAVLRRRSNGVARFSQHMLGHAMDFYIPGVQLDHLRAIGLRLQRGGVGFYPTSGSPFVHMDTGGIRMWPRMSREQLVRVFPDQRTVYLPSDGRPLAGYDLALADIRKRGDGGDVSVADAGHLNPLKKLLHLARGESDEEESDVASGAPAAEPAASEPLRSRAKAAVTAAVDRVEDKLAAQKAKLAAAAAKAEEKLAAEKAKLAEAAAKAQEKLAAEKTKLAEAAAKAQEKLAAEKAKLVKVAAKARMIASAEAATATTTPNQVILARGFWQGVQDDGAAASAVTAVARPSRSNAAPTANDPAGSIEAFSASPALAGQDDRVAPDLALAYAEQPDREGAARALAAAPASGTDALRAALLRAAAQQAPDATTVAVKRVSGRNASVVVNVSTKKGSPLLADTTRLSDPWLRAIMVSPSVNNFLWITSLGARDFRSLAELMVKPGNSLMMTFAADPNPGLEYAHFSGSAAVFIPTVSYTLRTAQLQ
ncbi:MAG: DUF882 domain-containing protein [Xanthobacteraceae bacterium]